jgi:acetolactate synthase-1/2/3 large subunit
MASLLRAAKRVMIIAGGGAIGAAEEIRKLAEALHAPVQLTTNARGLLPVDHPLNADFGIGSADGRKVMNGAGVVLAIGTEMGETDYDFYATTPFAVEAPFLRIDVDPRQIAIGPRPTVGLVSDARLAVAALNAAIGTGAVKHDQRWTEAAIKTLGEIAYRNREPDDAFYDRFMTTVREAARDPIVVGDSTKPAYRAQATYRAPNPRSFFCSGTGFGTLGYALPAAIGAKVANADRNVVCLIGDGGAQFTLPELISAREAKAGIVMLVWNNNGYREIKDYMVAKEIKPVAVDVSPPDFCTFAKSVGVKGVRVDTLDALAKALSGHAPTSDQPLLIEAGPWMIE